MQTLHFLLNGQKLSKAPGFPDVVERSNDFLQIFIDGETDGYQLTAYFSLSWDTKNVYGVPIVANTAIIPEFITTLPDDPCEFVDYVVSVSIAGIGQNSERLTTNMVDIIVDKTAYRPETANTPEIPQSQYDAFVETIREYSTGFSETVERVDTAAATAAGSAAEATERANDASVYAQNAKQSELKSAEFANKAEESVLESETNAENAGKSASAAQLAQEKAEQAAERIENADLNAWKQHVANAIKGTPIGGAIPIYDISPIEHDAGVQVFSKNLIPYPYTLKTNSTQGTIVTDNGDGSITFEGVPDTNFAIDISDSVKVPKSGVYFLSATSYPSDGKLYFIFVNMENGKQFTTADLRAVTLEATTYRVAAVFQKIFFTDNNITTVTLKPQLELGTSATEYAPYVRDLTAVSVKKYGKNLVDIPATTLSGSYNGAIDGGWRLDAIPYRGQKITWQTYVDTSKLSSNYTGSIIAKLFFYMEDGTPITSATGNAIKINSNSRISYISSSVPNNAERVSLVVIITVAPNDGESVTFKDNMLSIGDSVTEYEPYKEPTTFTVAADGTVDGVTSSDLYPDATLIPDTHGVNITAEYNKDTGKVIQNLVDAIISLGGNV